jgi:hypothetical protein
VSLAQLPRPSCRMRVATSVNTYALRHEHELEGCWETGGNRLILTATVVTELVTSAYRASIVVAECRGRRRMRSRLLAGRVRYQSDSPPSRQYALFASNHALRLQGAASPIRPTSSRGYARRKSLSKAVPRPASSDGKEGDEARTDGGARVDSPQVRLRCGRRTISLQLSRSATVR